MIIQRGMVSRLLASSHSILAQLCQHTTTQIKVRHDVPFFVKNLGAIPHTFAECFSPQLVDAMVCGYPTLNIRQGQSFYSQRYVYSG